MSAVNPINRLKTMLLMLLLFSCKSCLTETPWTAASQASLSPTIYWSLPKFMSFELEMLLMCPHLKKHVLLISVFLLCVKNGTVVAR